MRIVGLDLALRTGVCDGVLGETPALSLVDFSREFDTDVDVFARVLRWITRLLQDPPDLIVAEAPVAMFDKSLQQGVRGVVLGAAGNAEVRIIEVPVQTWRKYALGAGNMKGKTAKHECIAMCERLGWRVPITRGGNPDHNAAEAAGIWLWACAQSDPRNAIRHEPLFTRSA